MAVETFSYPALGLLQPSTLLTPETLLIPGNAAD